MKQSIRVWKFGVFAFAVVACLQVFGSESLPGYDCVRAPEPGEGFLGVYGPQDPRMYKQAETLIEVLNNQTLQSLLKNRDLTKIEKSGAAPEFKYDLSLVERNAFFAPRKSKYCAIATYNEQSITDFNGRVTAYCVSRFAQVHIQEGKCPSNSSIGDIGGPDRPIEQIDSPIPPQPRGQR